MLILYNPFLIMSFFPDTIFQCLEVSPLPFELIIQKKKINSLISLTKVFVTLPSVNTKLYKPQNFILTLCICSPQEGLELHLQFSCNLSKEKHRLLQIFALTFTGKDLNSGEAQ